MNISYPSRQHGAALILSLIILFIVTGITISISSDFQVLFHRTQYQLIDERNTVLFHTAETYARRLLVDDIQNIDPSDNLSEKWAQPFEVNLDSYSSNIKIKSQLYDLQGRFNINNLSIKDEVMPQPSQTTALTIHQQRFVRLLQSLNLVDMTTNKAIELTEAITDWLDSDDDVSGFGGAEYEYYEDLNPSIRPPNKTISDVSEIRLVKGMTNEIYHALSPHLTVWPLEGNSEININTVTTPILASLNNTNNYQPLNTIEVQWLEDIRRIGRFPSLDVFQQGPFQNRRINLDQINDSSNYFLLITEITHDNMTSYSQAVIYRDEIMTKVISRTWDFNPYINSIGQKNNVLDK